MPVKTFLKVLQTDYLHYKMEVTATKNTGRDEISLDSHCHHLDEVKLLGLPQLRRELHGPLPLLVLHLVPPESVLVVVREGIHHYGDGQGEDEGSR